MSGTAALAVIVCTPIVCFTIYQLWERWLEHKEMLAGVDEDDEQNDA